MECRAAGASLTIEEIDPDVFGEELLEPGYNAVERVAAVGICIRPWDSGPAENLYNRRGRPASQPGLSAAN